MRVLPVLALVIPMLALLAGPALAQQPEKPKESIQIGLSTDTIQITSGFTGTDLTIFGAVDNLDPEISRQGHYDVIVVLEGPNRTATVRRKERFLGIWINRQSRNLPEVPISYSMAMTRPIQDIAPDSTMAQMAIGVQNFPFARPPQGPRDSRTHEFAIALLDLKQKSGLYKERPGSVRFLSLNLFRASVALPANVPVGTHTARAYLFRNGVFVNGVTAPLGIVKSGLEAEISRISRDNSFAFGLFAVGLAILTGWLGRLIFRRD